MSNDAQGIEIIETNNQIDLNDITVYKSSHDLQHLGRKADGGYTIANISKHYNLLISGGVFCDVSFEHDFVTEGFTDRVVLYDGEFGRRDSKQSATQILSEYKVKNQQFNNPSFEFVVKNIAGFESETTTDLHDMILSTQNIFVKMDVEGAEYSWINSLDQQHLDNIEQMCVEFHSPHESPDRWNIFKKINQTHALVNVHANNWNGIKSYVMINDVIVPRVLECTYIHKRHIEELIPNDTPLPRDFEFVNFLHQPEIVLNKPPFCCR